MNWWRGFSRAGSTSVMAVNSEFAARADALDSVGEDFRLRRVAAQRDGMNVAARSIVAVGVIEMQGVARLREFLDADAALEFPQYPVPAEDVVETGPNPGSRVSDDSAARRRRRRHVIVEQALKLGVKIFRQKPSLGTQLQDIRKR
jgi:hypothetical protein